MATIRTIRQDDAAMFLSLRKQLDTETNFMLLEPGERKTNEETVGQQLNNILTQDNATLLVAEDDGMLVGFIAADGGFFRRNYHTAKLVIGLLKSHQGLGLGTQLFQKIEEWAKDHQIHRLELMVMEHNQAAIALYQKMGFAIEGIKRDNLLINGKWINELLMAKILG
jgi:RimJ/RimL family protein N-acetyltransferase